MTRSFKLVAVGISLLSVGALVAGTRRGSARAATSPRPPERTPSFRPGDRGLDPDLTFPESLLVQNGGPVLNLKRPPEPWMRPAKGDGQTDDTDAFRDAYDLLKREFVKHGGWNPDSYYLYLPNGVYKVTDTLIYRGKTVGASPTWNGQFDINHIRFIGQNRRKAIIRLADHSPGYGDPAKPKSVMALQHPDTIFNNVPGGNWLRNFTISIGKGNPGAVALTMQGANQTDLSHFTARSEDGAGRYGIWFKIGSIQGYYSDVTVAGFDIGIFDEVNPEGDPAFEYLTLKNQKVAGILHTGGGMSLRGVLSDQSAHGATALKLDGSGVQTVLLDSALKGGSPKRPAVEMTRRDEQCLFARNVATLGYGHALVREGHAEVSGARIEEYVSSPPLALSPGQPLRSLSLPVRDTPRVPWFNPETQWAIVDEYPSVQAAIASGKPVICFKKSRYRVNGDIRVPASVRFINGMASTLEGGEFVVAEASREPILVQDMIARLRIDSRRDVIQRCAGGAVSNPKGLPVTLWLENVNDNTSGDDFCRPGQRVYARQIDIEYGQGSQIVANGGTLWIFGFKTENMGANPFTVKNGGSLEVLGGYCNQTNRPEPEKQNPLLLNDQSNASATLFTNLGGPFVKAVVEQRGGETQIAPNTAFPRRGSVYRTDYVIPLYVGYRRK